MATKILIAVDESKDSVKAVKYVAKGMNSAATVTLFSVLSDPTAACGLDSPSLTPLFRQNRQAFCALEDTKKDTVDAFMQKAKKVLVESGFASKNVAIKIRKKKVGIARDILKEVEQGKYEIPWSLEEGASQESSSFSWAVFPIKSSSLPRKRLSLWWTD